MLNRVKKVIVAKNIARTAALTAATLYTGTNGPAAGEVVILDKNRNLLAAGSTVADTDTIYVAVGTGETYSTTNEAGTTVTGIRKLLFSDPIEGNKIKSYTARTYAAPTECAVSISLAGYTPVAGDSYVIRLVYKDVPEHPGQFTYTYRVISADAVLDNLGAALAAVINKHEGARVTATYTAGTDTLLLTAKVVTDASSLGSVNDIDFYRQVNFEAFFWRYDNTNNLQVSLNSAWTKSYTNPNPGSGQPKLVRDEEKRALGYKGITNQWYFPVIKPDLMVDMALTYNTIVIESEKGYLAADNQYLKTQPLSTVIFLPVGAGQTTDILAVLNPWMESAGQLSIVF